MLVLMLAVGADAVLLLVSVSVLLVLLLVLVLMLVLELVLVLMLIIFFLKKNHYPLVLMFIVMFDVGEFGVVGADVEFGVLFDNVGVNFIVLQ